MKSRNVVLAGAAALLAWWWWKGRAGASSGPSSATGASSGPSSATGSSSAQVTAALLREQLGHYKRDTPLEILAAGPGGPQVTTVGALDDAAATIALTGDASRYPIDLSPPAPIPGVGSGFTLVNFQL